MSSCICFHTESRIPITYYTQLSVLRILIFITHNASIYKYVYITLTPQKLYTFSYLNYISSCICFHTESRIPIKYTYYTQLSVLRILFFITHNASIYKYVYITLTPQKLYWDWWQLGIHPSKGSAFMPERTRKHDL